MPLPTTNLDIKLYEGNFDTWRKHISDAFMVRGRSTQVYPAVSHRNANGTIVYHESTLGDMQFVLSSITPSLMKRIPEDLQLGVGPLYACLESLCTPFRLFDLPPELRLRIYEPLVLCHHKLSLTSPQHQNNDTRHWETRHPIPVLAQASAQLRREVLPLFFSMNVFGPRGDTCQPESLQGVLNEWLRDVVRDNLTHLRTFQLDLPAWRQGEGIFGLAWKSMVSVRLTYTVAKGLRVECKDRGLTAESTEMLEDLVADVDGQLEPWGLKGEGITQVLYRICEMGLDGEYHAQPWPGLQLY